MTPATVAEVVAALALDATPAQVEGLEAYARLLQRWGRSFNLTSIHDPAAVLTHHLADCLAVVPRLLERSIGPRLLDAGSGAGLPAVPLAVMLPSVDVVAVDAVAKKVAFVRQVAAELRLPNLTARHERLESMRDANGFATITARAVSSLADIVAATRHLLAPGGAWIVMKGQLVDTETAALPPDVLFHVEPLTVPGLDAVRRLVWLRLRAETGVDFAPTQSRARAVDKIRTTE